AKGIELWMDALRHAEQVVARHDVVERQVELTLEEVRGEVPRHALPAGSRKREDVRIREAIRLMIGQLVEDVIQTSGAAIARHKIALGEEAMRHGERLVAMSELLEGQLNQLAFYLRDVVYYHPEKLLMEQKAKRIVRGLFEAFAGEPRLLPRGVQERLESGNTHRVVCDYVSSMTDRSALDLYNRLFETYEIGFGGGMTSGVIYD
ncbi:MAG: hypothetical protein ACRDF1_10910, partial [bacterium]